jgi:hypothetical protein
MKQTRRHALLVLTALVGLSGIAFGVRGPSAANDTLPKQLDDRAFWSLVTEASEPGGFFRSDNFLSNETTYQEVIPELRRRSSPDGVYFGVGPDQNFTYIAALKPRMAFIIDIRRQNMIEHLMYKALIEASSDRADFLSRLFSRPRPAGLDRAAPPKDLLDAYDGEEASEALFQKNFEDIVNRLTKRHGFALTADDLRSLEYVCRAFYSEGPELRYSFPRQTFGARWFPTYADLMTKTDLDGVNHAYLANEAAFKTLKDYQTRNLLVPIVGDFGGDKALRTVGRWVREHGGTVNYFYTSNVEQYLFQSDAWEKYYDSVATLPLNDNSTFIRAYFNMGFRYPPGIVTPDLHSLQLLDPIKGLLDAYHAGQIHNYYDVVGRPSPVKP